MDKPTDEMMSTGFLYVAVGDDYFHEAEKSARSLRIVSPQAQICLVTNSNLKSEFFDIILPIEEVNFDGKRGYISKAYGMKVTPYQKTVFVDTDTFFAGSADELFKILDYFDLAIAHDYMEDSLAIVNEGPLDGFRTYNTGVLVFNKSESFQVFLDSWINCYLRQIDVYWSDQPALMEALLYTQLKTYSLQTNYNFRFNQFLTIPNGKVKILHGRHKSPLEIANILNVSEEHRSWDPKLWSLHGWKEDESFWKLIRRAVKSVSFQ